VLGHDRGDEGAALVGQLVHDHLAVALGAGERVGLQVADVMRDELLVAPDDPREVADASPLTGRERERDRQTGRVAEGLGGGRGGGELVGGR
jgi:hypothetical protein